MDKEKSFKLFSLPRLNSSQVSAVKPQAIAGDGGFFQGFNKFADDDFNLPFTMKSLPHPNKNKSSDLLPQKVKHLPVIEEENVESMAQLYSKLYNEAEKIKRWKLSVESEMKQKEKKIQENKKTIDAQRKAIQELQFENEKLSLKLEDEMHENKDLLNENNATRHLCDLLKETCARSEEKTNMYEVEREETRQLYVELNNNIEKMIMAFEELRVQAENSRMDMYFKFKEESEKKQKLDNEFKTHLNIKEKQVLLLKHQNEEKDNELINIKHQLHEAMHKINDLEKIKEQQNKMLRETDEKLEELMVQFQRTKDSLQKSENVQKNLETELQAALTKLVQVSEDKEAEMEELKETKALHALAVDELQVTVYNLKEQLILEKERLKESEDKSQQLILELQKKSTEFGEMSKLKNDNETELQGLKKALESSLMVQKDLEQQVIQEKSQNRTLMKEIEMKDFNHGNFKGTIQGLVDEKDHLEKTVKILQENEKELQDIIQIREKKIRELEIQATTAVAEHEENLYKQLVKLKEERDKEMLKYEEFIVDYNRVLLAKEQMAKDVDNAFTEVKILQNSLKARNIENEISKKEKQLKTLENKFNILKKQIENKNRSIEDLQQENKTFKKKISSDSKQCSAQEAEVIQLKAKLENIRLQSEKSNNSYQKEIKERSFTEEKLREEAERMKVIADEAQKMQKETDIRCQHKIAEMVALMEKHKHQYDKMVEEKDAELGLHKTKEQETISTKVSLEIELCCLKKELMALKEQFEKVEEKEMLARVAKEKKEVKHKSLVSEEDMFKKLYKELPEAAPLFMTSSKKVPSSVSKSPGTALKLATVKKMRESGWTAVANVDRKKKNKAAEKLFT
uniref:Synaptonemal complex protein 1 isoform X2 n=1 Tax=Geotrypetes seraphini TaxID=260995 RepID=A0A6P8NGF7_GEOSA|nr:synaptonemal complex protein 1 isoform X2 [Geotrypetes seraphini]